MGRKLIFNNEFERLYNYDGELGVVYSKEKSKFILSKIFGKTMS